MSWTEFRRLSISEGEEAIVEIWKCLEEYDLPTPRMTISFLGGKGIIIRLDIEDPLWAIVLRRRLSNSAVPNAYVALTYWGEKQGSRYARAVQVAPLVEKHASTRLLHRRRPK